MVLFTLSFLLAFQDKPKKVSYRNSRISAKNGKIRGSFLKRNSLRLSVPSMAKRRTADTIVTSIRDGIVYMRPSSKNMKTCHIYYLLSPSQMINISVAVRGEIAKVCTKDDVVAMRTIKIDSKTRWVAFSITHRIQSPETSLEITNWNLHRIEFNISENPVNVFPSARRDDIYYGKTNINSTSTDCGDINFEELNIVSEMKGEEEESASLPPTSRRSGVREQIFTKLQAVPSPTHIESVKAKIFAAIPFPQAFASIKNDGSINEEVGEETTAKTHKKKGKETSLNKKSGRKSLLTITGTKLLYDKRTWSDGHLHVTQHVQMFNVWLTTTNFINEELRNELIPLGIYIRKLIDFPNIDKISSMDGFKIKYSLGDLIKNIVITPKSTEHTLNEIEIEDVKLFFLGTVPLLKIIENLQMHKLVVEIYGPKAEEQQEAKLCNWDDLNKIAKRNVHQPPIIDVHRKAKIRKKNKGQKKVKFTKPKSGKSTTPDGLDLSKLHLLGYAEVNCSALAADGFRLDVDTNVSQFNSSEEVKTIQALKHFDLYSVHENINEEHNAVIENGVFVASKSFLRVNLRISGLPLASSVERMELFKNLYKRILIIFHEKSIMVPILKRILKLNAAVLGYKYNDVPWVPYWFARKLDQTDRFATLEHPCILSGFAIEFDDICVMMIEGLNDYTFPEAMKDVFFLPTSYGRVLYDDQLIFTQRLYQEFFPNGGVYTIASKISIDDVMYNWKTFLRGTIPIPAKRALFQINKLLQCSTIQLASMEKLFPQPQDLISFDIEFGSPPKWPENVGLERQ